MIIIPCYNESNRMPVDEYSAYLGSEGSKHFEFLFVDDGSTDSTLDLLKNLSENFTHCSCLHLEKNVGKAEAIRSAVIDSRSTNCEYIGYFDADLATPLSELQRLRSVAMEYNNAQLIIGSRIKILGMTDIKRKLRRHYIGRIFATIVSNMLKLPIYDTQCGAKLIKTEKAIKIFKDSFISRWLFDVELIFRLKKLTSQPENEIVEMPLKRWEDKAVSKIKATYFFIAPLDLLRIYLRYS